MSRGRKVVVVGSGGREHALAQALLESASVQEVVVTPGNAGTQGPSTIVGKALRNVKGRAFDVAIAEKPDLVVVGPEQPLCDGLTDALSAQDILVYGPTLQAARLEGSKAFMKSFAQKIGLATARHVVVSDPSEVAQAVANFPAPPVIKADGLCAGKGVVMVESHEEACTVANQMLTGQSFGDAGRVVVLEERLSGQEVSIHAVCDGNRAIILPAAQDHKRLLDGDRGPNTGGMGAYAPAPIVNETLLGRIDKEIVTKVLDGMRAEGSPFRGTLFVGLMIADTGDPSVLEFNVRFGDPETQVLMNVIQGDLCELLTTAARGSLNTSAVEVTSKHALCVVLAAKGYPAEPHKGDAILGLSEAIARPNVRVYHAGTSTNGNRIVTTGGRVLGVTGFGQTLQKAAVHAYSAVDCIEFEGRQFRCDIGHRAL
jgi:phosphoribosylamine---glycine ligase